MWQYNHTPDPNELYHYGVKGMKWKVKKAKKKVTDVLNRAKEGAGSAYRKAYSTAVLTKAAKNYSKTKPKKKVNYKNSPGSFGIQYQTRAVSNMAGRYATVNKAFNNAEKATSKVKGTSSNKTKKKKKSRR